MRLSPPAAFLQWEDARAWAERFWERAAADERISSDFRQICRENRASLDEIGKGSRMIE